MFAFLWEGPPSRSCGCISRVSMPCLSLFRSFIPPAEPSLWTSQVSNSVQWLSRCAYFRGQKGYEPLLRISRGRVGRLW
ncbi:hypothetical protein M404DRAFT_180762 [Pisolithus tinctorius Marx 270]|uniref:Uncharacterized protein n=1 Tax=Pisolithus tinctorius Marx 270 TaxID=870435 RepID=A0A0C3PKB5_PISTI|nr:hypothetical protein M404DRAFT_180762 [Pisolithus tinctorius Marx 270]